ncbi:MAG: hypothetical protein R3C53_28335 [Pirellulaceae bacterium]
MSETTFPIPSINFSRRVADATASVFGDSTLTLAVRQACERFDRDVANIHSGRGINALLIAIVGAKGQGKTWAARQFIRDEAIKSRLLSGDLQHDATTRLVWIGPVAPENLNPETEVYFPCQVTQLAQIDAGRAYVILDTPGMTDADALAASLAKEALSLAPIKLLVIARDQIRAACNMTIAHQIDGAVCIPVISSVEPEEIDAGEAVGSLAVDLRELLDQLRVMAPRCEITPVLLVPDFEVTGDEEASGQLFMGGILDRLSDLDLNELSRGSAREQRLQSANERLRREVARLIGDELPQLAEAVDQLNRETQQLPSRVLTSLLGSEVVLETGVRMRLRARLVADTALIWFPYRTVLGILNLTQGAWDRVMLALTGSVPSLFGALTSWARNIRQNRDFNNQVQDGIRQRTQQQVEERLQPLCDQFHRTVMKLRPREERSRETSVSTGMRLTGIDELQTRSQQIFEAVMERSATSSWMTQVYALVGMLIFWILMAGPVFVIYREYFETTYHVFSGQEAHLDHFPHPTPGLFFTSLLLSILPLAIYCMVILTWTLGRRKIRAVARQVVTQHEVAIEELQSSRVIRLQFEDDLLQQAEFLLNLQENRPVEHRV